MQELANAEELSLEQLKGVLRVLTTITVRSMLRDDKASRSKRPQRKKIELEIFHFSREIYIKTEVFLWSILFILFILRLLIVILLYSISGGKPILDDFKNGFL